MFHHENAEAIKDTVKRATFLPTEFKSAATVYSEKPWSTASASMILRGLSMMTELSCLICNLDFTFMSTGCLSRPCVEQNQGDGTSSAPQSCFRAVLLLLHKRPHSSILDRQRLLTSIFFWYWIVSRPYITTTRPPCSQFSSQPTIYILFTLSIQSFVDPIHLHPITLETTYR